MCEYRRGMDWILVLLTPLYTLLGTTSNYSSLSLSLSDFHNTQITTAPTNPFSTLPCLKQPFPSNDFPQWRLFSFQRSRHCCRRISHTWILSTVNSTIASSPHSPFAQPNTTPINIGEKIYPSWYVFSPLMISVMIVPWCNASYVWSFNNLMLS
jgi:hypothetical protein